MKKDRFFTAVYCPPYPPKGKYPNRITEAVYQILKDVGIDHIFGHFEDNYGRIFIRSVGLGGRFPLRCTVAYTS